MRSLRIQFRFLKKKKKSIIKLHFPWAALLIGRHTPHEISRYVRPDPALCLAHSQLLRSVYKAGQRRKEDGWGDAARDCK